MNKLQEWRSKKKIKYTGKEKKKVYILELDNGMIKIGISNNISFRIRELEQKNDYKVLSFISSEWLEDYRAYEVEQTLHVYYSQYSTTLPEHFNVALKIAEPEFIFIVNKVKTTEKFEHLLASELKYIRKKTKNPSTKKYPQDTIKRKKLLENLEKYPENRKEIQRQLDKC